MNSPQIASSHCVLLAMTENVDVFLAIVIAASFPSKTRIIYCKDVDRDEAFENVKFDFLGFSFQPRLSKDKNERRFVNFSPAISSKACKNSRSEIRSWKLHRQTDKSLKDLAVITNAKIQGRLTITENFTNLPCTKH